MTRSVICICNVGTAYAERNCFYKLHRTGERDYIQGEPLEYDTKHIRIVGYAETAAHYNRWLQGLVDEPWIAESRHVSYEDNDEGVGEFEVWVEVVE